MMIAVRCAGTNGYAAKHASICKPAMSFYATEWRLTVPVFLFFIVYVLCIEDLNYTTPQTCISKWNLHMSSYTNTFGGGKRGTHEKKIAQNVPCCRTRSLSARAPFHCSLSDKNLWSVSPHPWDNFNLKKGSCCSRISCTFIVHRLHNIDLPCEEAGMKPLSASHHQS